MEKNNQLDEVLSRINDMRGFFKFGDEVIPFLGDLFTFLKKIMPLMSDMNSSLQDSAKTLPTASDRIDDVNKATEFATVEIMDTLDRILVSLDALPGLEKESQNVSIETMKDEVANIVNALQFQDITSQKLSHANKILGAIYQKFNTLFASLEEAKASSTIGRQVLEAIEEQVDTDARTQEQEDFQEKTKDEIRHVEISQDDIDSLFG